MPVGVYIRTEEVKKHMSKIRKGRIVTEKTKQKMSEAQKGKILSEESKQKLSKALEGNTHAKGNKNMLGKHHSEEAKRKMSKSQEEKVGEKSPNWKGGISLKKGYGGFLARRRQIRKLKNGGSHTFGEWENLKAQYNWTCLICSKSEPEIQLTEDHIIPISKGGSDNIENIQPLCRSCNCKKHTRIFRINPDKSRGLF